MKFVPDSMKEEKPEVEVTREGRVTRSKIIYPDPRRTDREYYEYEYGEENSEDQ